MILYRFKQANPGRKAIEDNKFLLRAKYQLAKGISNDVNGAREVAFLTFCSSFGHTIQCWLLMV